MIFTQKILCVLRVYIHVQSVIKCMRNARPLSTRSIAFYALEYRLYIGLRKKNGVQNKTKVCVTLVSLHPTVLNGHTVLISSQSPTTGSR